MVTIFVAELETKAKIWVSSLVVDSAVFWISCCPMSPSQESGHEYSFYFFLLKLSFYKIYFKAKWRENQISTEILTVDLHSDCFLQFRSPANHCAQVLVFILETNRIHDQRGCGPLSFHLSVQWTVNLSSPRQ